MAFQLATLSIVICQAQASSNISCETQLLSGYSFGAMFLCQLEGWLLVIDQRIKFKASVIRPRRSPNFVSLHFCCFGVGVLARWFRAGFRNFRASSPISCSPLESNQYHGRSVTSHDAAESTYSVIR